MSQPRLYHFARLWVELTRQLHATVAPDLQDQFGSRVPLLLIGAAVYLSTVEGRPMTASKLADYVGMPRATVIRRLDMLRRLGVVERINSKWRTPAKRLALINRTDPSSLARLVKAAAGKAAR